MVLVTRLEKSIQLALQVHSGQVDLGGNPYILHPLRVLCRTEEIYRVKDLVDRESLLCSAVLHDVIEDAEKSIYYSEVKTFGENPKDHAARSILRVAGDTTLKTVLSLSREEGESWKHYILRLNEYWAPRVIKIIDLADNADRSRLKEYTDKDRQRDKMYLSAYAFLTTGSWK